MRSTSAKRVTFSFLASIFVTGAMLAQTVGGPVPNWEVPPYRASGSSGGITTMVDISDASVFVAVTPCRVFDTRNAPGAYGGPRLSANTPRNFDIDSGPCTGIPVGAAAYSMSFAAILPDDDGFLSVWPAGSAQPLVSSMNFLMSEVIANAAIVPAGTGGAISVFASQGTHLLGDINGYFMDLGGDLNGNLQWHGNTTNSFMFVFNRNTTSSSTITSSIRGYMESNQNNVSGVTGELNNASGANSGVKGINGSSSSNAAGVRGFAPAAVPGTHVYAGVRGESNNGGTGVLGMVNTFSGEGVSGFQLDPTTGAELAGGHLGFTTSSGIVFFNGLSGSGTKSFIEPHPTDASKMIKFISLEGNEPGTYFRGKGRFQNGVAVITVPEDFRMVTDSEDLSIQVTPIGQMATVAVESIGLDRIVVRGSRNVEFFYTVNGVRRAYKGAEIIVANDKMFIPTSPDAPIPLWLSPDERQRLISNGTYRPDGTVNMETAQRLGWDRVWEGRGRPEPRPEPAQ